MVYFCGFFYHTFFLDIENLQCTLFLRFSTDYDNLNNGGIK